MAGRQCKMTVHITDPETGDSYTYLEGQTVPEEHAKLVTMDRVWGGRGRKDSGGEGTDDDPNKTAPASKYEEMKVPELLNEVRERELDMPSSAKKAELIAALVEDDENDDEGDDEEDENGSD